MSHDAAAPTAHQLSIGPDESLTYYALGAQTPPTAAEASNNPPPTIILLHGMRDTGRSLLPIAARLADRFTCVLPDLRGHGDSTAPGYYAIAHYLMDLRRLVNHLALDRVALLGHSLGGHIACRYAGLFADSVSALMVVEGLGPPVGDRDAEADLSGLGARLDGAIATAERAHTPRVLPDRAAAADRLLANNPRLAVDYARQLAEWGTREVDGGVVWAFDPRAQEVFLGVSHQRNLDFWRATTAPTAVVMGADSHDYWASRFPHKDGRFAAGELTARLACFREAEYHEIPDASHQVHYDQPDAFATLARAFFGRTLL